MKMGEVQDAIKKQRPMEVDELDMDSGLFICGGCGGMVNFTDEHTSHEYCLLCGQRIDWRNTDR